jgi:hypothetical protein
MAKITQVGVGRKSTGTIDGITYYVRGGVTYARSAPNMPASVYNTPEAKRRQALFILIQMHLKYHLRTIRQTITPKGNGSPTNRYYSLNCKGLAAALTPLAELYTAGEDVTITDVEQAISDYAAGHPTSIKIASKNGYREVYLTGPWPETITLNALAGDSTVIIIVNEHGEQTTINADGSVVVSGNQGSGNGNDPSPNSPEGEGSNPNGGNVNLNDNDNQNLNGGGSNTGGNTGGGGGDDGDDGNQN